MNKISLLFCLFMAANVCHGQKGGVGLAGPLTVIDNQGHNVSVVPCSNLQCVVPYTFVSDPGTHTFPALSTPYVFMDLNWTLSTGSQLLFHVLLSDVNSAPSGVLYVYNGSARCTVTKVGVNIYSFVVETPDGI